MNRTNIFDLRDNLSSYLAEVAKKGIPLIVYRFKKPIAVIVPPGKEYLKTHYDDFFGFLEKDITGKKFEDKIRRNKIEKIRVKKLLKT